MRESKLLETKSDQNVTKNQVEEFFKDERKTFDTKICFSQEVAATIAYLCSHHSSLSNEVYRVDG